MRDAIAANPRVRLVFPHLLPAKPWDCERFTIRRPGSVIGPSVACLGVGVRSTGARADLLVCDDIVDVTALRSRADREWVKQSFRENLVNLLEPDGRLWYLFTPWHGDDLSADLARSGVYQHLRRAVGADLSPVWPEKWPAERLAERRREIGEVAFARAYRLECVPDGEVAVRPEWVRTWNDEAKCETVVLAIDPAAGVHECHDRTAIVTLGKMADGTVRCLEAKARRLSAPVLLRLIDEADSKWQPDVILFESNGGFAVLRDLLTAHTRFGSKVRSIVQTKDKILRICAFGVHVEAGRFLLRSDETGNVDATQANLFDEMTTFPLGEHDDLVDAAAFGTSWLLDKPSPRVW